MTSQKLFFSNGARLLNFSLKVLVIKLSAKLSGLSISLAIWINAFLLRVIKIFYKSHDLFFLINFHNPCSTLGIYAGLYIISRPWEEHWCLRIFAALSFPFPRFNLKTVNVNNHLQVT